jgi:hypothetical protein
MPSYPCAPDLRMIGRPLLNRGWTGRRWEFRYGPVPMLGRLSALGRAEAHAWAVPLDFRGPLAGLHLLIQHHVKTGVIAQLPPGMMNISAFASACTPNHAFDLSGRDFAYLP